MNYLIYSAASALRMLLKPFADPHFVRGVSIWMVWIIMWLIGTLMMMGAVFWWEALFNGIS